MLFFFIIMLILICFAFALLYLFIFFIPNLDLRCTTHDEVIDAIEKTKKNTPMQISTN